MVRQSGKSVQGSAIGQLARRDNIHGVIHIAGHFLLMGLCAGFLALAEEPWSRGFWTLTLGGLLVFLFAPLHETIHKTAFRSMLLNRMVAHLCGFLIFLPPNYFRAFHMAHHRYTQLPGKDPELATPKPRSMREYLIYLTGLVYWKAQGRMLVLYALGLRRDRFVSAGKHGKVVREARVYLVLYLAILFASLYLESSWVLQYWILPLIVGQPFLRSFLLAEHTEVSGMMENTRTTLCNPALRWLCWNMNHHVEHHAYPAVPFHGLPAAHLHMRDGITHLASGYLQVHRQVVASLR